MDISRCFYSISVLWTFKMFSNVCLSRTLLADMATYIDSRLNNIYSKKINPKVVKIRFAILSLTEVHKLIPKVRKTFEEIMSFHAIYFVSI